MHALDTTWCCSSPPPLKQVFFTTQHTLTPPSPVLSAPSIALPCLFTQTYLLSCQVQSR